MIEIASEGQLRGAWVLRFVEFYDSLFLRFVNNKNKKLVEYLRGIFEYFRRRYGSSLFEKHTCDNLIISDRV